MDKVSLEQSIDIVRIFARTDTLAFASERAAMKAVSDAAERLVKYAEHTYECGKYYGNPCSCGLDEIIAG